MAIQSIPPNDRRERFTALAGQTEFPFDFPLYDQEDLDVRRYRGGVETQLVVGADFTVAGIAEQAGGAIALAEPAEAGDLVVIRSAQAIGRTAMFADGGDLRAAALLAEFNRTHIALQQLALVLAQAIRLPPSDPADAAELPGPLARANAVLGFGAAGELLLRSVPSLAGAYFRQMGTGAVDRLVVDELALRIHPRQFGGAGDGSTDDTLAVQRCFDLAATLGGVAELDAGTWRVTATVTLPGSARGLLMMGQILYDGPGGQPALVLGDGGGGRNQAKRYEGIRVVRATQADWTDEADIGVQLRNADACHIQVVQAERFTIGVQAIGDAAGFEDTTVHLGRLADNRIGLDIRTLTSGGWANGNRFFGGHFAVSSGTHPTLDRFGVRLSAAAGAYRLHNSLTFDGPDFELQSHAGTVDAIPFLVEVDGRALVARSVRMEACSPYVARHTGAFNDALYQVVYVGTYGFTGCAVQYAATATRAGGTVVPHHQALAAIGTPRLVAAADDVRAGAFRWQRSGTVAVAGTHDGMVQESFDPQDPMDPGAKMYLTEVGFDGLAVLAGNPSGPPTNLTGFCFPGLSQFTLGTDHVALSTSRALAFVVRTDLCREFFLAADGTSLRPVVMQFAADETVLGEAYPALWSNMNALPAFTDPDESHHAPRWWEGNVNLDSLTGGLPLNRLQRVTLHPSCVYAAIGVRGGVAGAQLRSLRLYCPAEHAPPVLAGGGRRWGRRELSGTLAFDPPSLAAGAEIPRTGRPVVTVPYVTAGDAVRVGFSQASAHVAWTGNVTAGGASGTVTCNATNRHDTAAVDLAPGTLWVEAVKPRL